MNASEAALICAVISAACTIIGYGGEFILWLMR